MSIARRDYIMRLIEQFAQVLGRLLGLRKAGKLDEAQELINATADELLGSSRSMIEKVEAATAASLLGMREKVVMYAALTAEEAEIVALKGDARKAQARRRRALELYLEASRLGELDGASLEAVASLRQTVALERLDERYRDLLNRLPAQTK